MTVIIPISDLRSRIGQKVCLLGVVVEYSFPRMSNGTDYVMTLKIVDESQQKPELCVCMFHRNVDELPFIKAQGDIILLKRVLVREYKGEPTVNFNKVYSSYSLFSGSDFGNFTAYQPCSSPGVMEVVKRAIDNLRKWNQGVQLNLGMSDYLISFKDLTEAENFDVVCKVLHFRRYQSNGILYVWDGTDVPTLCITEKLDEEQRFSLPLQTEAFPLPSSVIQTFPRTGSILGLVVNEDMHFRNRLPAVNTWVRIRNFSCQPYWGLWYGLLKPSSKIKLLPDTDQMVLERQRSSEQRVKERGCLPMLWNPLCCQLTEFSFPSHSDYDDTPFSTLRDVIAFPESEDRVLFKCVVRVVALFMFKEETNIDLRRSAGANIIRLTLEDPTGRIQAETSLKDEVPFFTDEPLTLEWGNKVKRLLGVPDHESLDQCSSRYPPWIKICITSYLNDIDGSRSPDPYGKPFKKAHHVTYTKLV